MATFDPIFAADPNNPELIAADASITIFDPDDPGMAPVTITDPTGSPLANPLTVNDKGWGPAFKTGETLFRVGWSGAGFTGFFTSYESMRDTALAAKVAAEASAAEAATAADLVGAPADSAIATAINAVGSATKTALNASILDGIEADAVDPTGAISVAVRANVEPWSGPTVLAALPQVQRSLVIENDTAPVTRRTIGLGSSVGVGPNGGSSYPDDTVVAKVHDALVAKFNRLGHTWTEHNGSVNGTTVFGGSSTDYEAAKTAAGGVPTVVPLVYGMNEGTAAQYHAGLTYNGVYSTAVSLIQKIQGDGADPIMVIGPHPHTERATWTMPGGVPVAYPATDNQIPDDTLAESIVTVTSPSGDPVPASYRHLRVNEALRRAAVATGCLIIDAEPYWFDAIAEHGEDALFNGAEVVHPNLFGFQQSYHKAIADFARALNKPTVLTGTPSTGETVKRIATNETYSSTTRATSAALQFTALPNSTYEVVIDFDYTVPTANDARISFETPTGASGRLRGIGPSPTTTTVNGGEVIARSTVITGNMPFGGNTSDATASIRATVITGSTGGVVGLQIGLDVTGGTVTVYAGSLLRAKKIA